jgi:DNA-binding CsgD family transcriptional regulator
MKKQTLTESEQIIDNEFHIYRLAKLALQDEKKFLELCNYLPFTIHINSLDFNMIYMNPLGESLLNYDLATMKKEGLPLIAKISDRFVMQQVISMIKNFERKKDSNSMLSHFQRLVLKGKMSWFITHKILHNEGQSFFNLSYMIEDLGKPGIILEDSLEEALIKRNGWEIFCSLGKREKEVLELLAAGLTSKEIADRLFISKLTVDTHRRNIFDKTGIKTYVELVRFAQAFYLIT